MLDLRRNDEDICHNTRFHNEFTLDQMKACIELAEKYGGSFRHVVTGLQITGIEKTIRKNLSLNYQKA